MVSTVEFKKRTLMQIADMICGNCSFFSYRSSSYLTEFFQDCDTDYEHDGSTRNRRTRLLYRQDKIDGDHALGAGVEPFHRTLPLVEDGNVNWDGLEALNAHSALNESPNPPRAVPEHY